MSIRKMEEHLLSHPTDYQTVISLYKARSKEIEKGRRERANKELKKISEWRKKLNGQQA